MLQNVDSKGKDILYQPGFILMEAMEWLALLSVEMA